MGDDEDAHAVALKEAIDELHELPMRTFMQVCFFRIDQHFLCSRHRVKVVL